MGDVAHIQNSHATEEVAVQFDGQVTRWGAGETKIVPKEQSAHFLRWGVDSAGQQALILLDTERSGIAYAESELKARQRELAQATELQTRAAENVKNAEKNLKVARATRDALLKQDTILEKK